MGYDSTIYGELAIEPPLRWAEFRDSPNIDAKTARDKGKAVCFAVDVEDVDTEDGTLTVRTAGRLVPAFFQPEKLYNILDEIQEVVDAHPGHEFVGEFRGEGADFGDIWLIRVVDRKVVRVLPTITWPDGTVLHNDRYQDEERVRAKRRR